MSYSDAGYNYDRYRRLLAEADDEPKRLAFINLLVEEKAKDRLAEQSLRARLSGLGLKTSSRGWRAKSLTSIAGGETASAAGRLSSCRLPSQRYRAGRWSG